MSQWPPGLSEGPRAPLPPRTRMGVVLAVIAAVLLVALVAVLARVFAAAALGLLGTGSTVTPGHAAHATPTVGQATARAASATTTDWTRYVNPSYGFQLDLPGALASGHGFFINDASGQGFDMAYANAPLTTSLQRLESETVVEVLYASAITDRDICPDAGAPVTLGAGIPGRAESNAPPLTNGPAANYPYIRASVAQGGVAVRFELRGQPPAETFMARYGAIWSHMLASFAPVSGGPAYVTHPCG
ncbi:MAG TPA: hypothetical protein VGR57_10245 [Ktedonobacterales bacterium]|nr:hypothetical protein [Ktedonobacterales bacterium]